MEATKTASSILITKSEKPGSPVKRPYFFFVMATILVTILFLNGIASAHPVSPDATIHSCLDIIRYKDYRNFAIATRTNEKIGNVQLVEQLIPGQQTVVVPIMDADSQQLLDLYMYSCVNHDHHLELTLRFKEQQLTSGLFSITRANTLNISSLDTSIMPNPSSPTQFQQTINREYCWQRNTFVQTAFPGLYPVLSRAEAEDLQKQFDVGEPFPWADPIITAKQLAKDILHWNIDQLNVSLTSQTTGEAHVLIQHIAPAFNVDVTLKRLIEHGDNGLWFVTGAQTDGITLDTFPLQTPISSPTTIHGTIATSTGSSSLQLFDHVLSPLPLLEQPTFQVHTDQTYTGRMLYSNDILNQPGLLLIEQTPPASSTQQGQLFLANVLLD